MKRTVPGPAMVSKRTWPGLLLTFALGALAGAGIGVFGFIRIVGGSGAPSRPIDAPPVSAGTAGVIGPTAGPSPNGAAPAVAGDAISGQGVFQIVPEESAARFIVGEQDPRGTVVGITDQVAGEIFANFDRARESQLGTIRINVRTLQTDVGDRDEALRGVVLESARPEFEFAEFVPTGIEGLPAEARMASPVRLRVHGDLNLHGTTRPLTFFGLVTFVSADELRGFLAWAGEWSEFGLFDEPLLRHLVSDELILEIDFVARRLP